MTFASSCKQMILLLLRQRLLEPSLKGEMLDIVRMDKINPGLLIAFPLPFIFPRDCFCFMFFLPGEFVYILRARNVHCGPVVCSAENELKGGESNNQLLQRLGRLSVTGRTKMKFYCHVISYSACVREDPYLG